MKLLIFGRPPQKILNVMLLCMGGIYTKKSNVAFISLRNFFPSETLRNFSHYFFARNKIPVRMLKIYQRIFRPNGRHTGWWRRRQLRKEEASRPIPLARSRLDPQWSADSPCPPWKPTSLASYGAPYQPAGESGSTGSGARIAPVPQGNPQAWQAVGLPTSPQWTADRPAVEPR